MGWRCGLAIFGVCAIQAASPAFAADTAEAWTRAHAITLKRIEPGGTREDLRFLRKLVGNARVVSFGEGMHGAHEALTFRNRLFEYLVEELGFTAIAAETDFVDGTAIDDYVTGRGELTPALVAGVFSFGAPDMPIENRQLLEWMRSYNTRPGIARQVHFYGLDMMGRALEHEQPIAERALTAALDYVAAVGDPQARRLEERVSPMLEALISRRHALGKGAPQPPYVDLTSLQRDVLTATLADLVALFERRQVQWIAKTSVLAYERAYRSALNARSLDADLRANGWWLGCWELSDRCDPDQRDATSARNLIWALRQEGLRGRVMLFEHAGHVRKGPMLEKLGPIDVRYTSLGQHLQASLGADMVVIGSLVGRAQGFPSGTTSWFDGVSPMLTELGRAALALNLRQLPARGPAASWWNRGIHDSEGRILNPVECFDALVFFQTATPARLVPVP